MNANSSIVWTSRHHFAHFDNGIATQSLGASGAQGAQVERVLRCPPCDSDLVSKLLGFRIERLLFVILKIQCGDGECSRLAVYADHLRNREPLNNSDDKKFIGRNIKVCECCEQHLLWSRWVDCCHARIVPPQQKALVTIEAHPGSTDCIEAEF